MTLGQKIALQKYQRETRIAKCCICGKGAGDWNKRAAEEEAIITVEYYDGHPDESMCRKCFDDHGVAGLGGIERD